MPSYFFNQVKEEGITLHNRFVPTRVFTENSRRKDPIEHIDSTSRGNRWFDFVSY
jgi:hypothetical protein